MEEPASEAAPRRAQGAEAVKSPEPAASTPADLEVIPDTPEADVDGVPEMTMEAPEVTMDALETADPPPAAETAPSGTSMDRPPTSHLETAPSSWPTAAQRLQEPAPSPGAHP